MVIITSMNEFVLRSKAALFSWIFVQLQLGKGFLFMQKAVSIVIPAPFYDSRSDCFIGYLTHYFHLLTLPLLLAQEPTLPS